MYFPPREILFYRCYWVSLVNLTVLESSVIMRNDDNLVRAIRCWCIYCLSFSDMLLSLWFWAYFLLTWFMIAYWHFQDNDYRFGFKLTITLTSCMMLFNFEISFITSLTRFYVWNFKCLMIVLLLCRMCLLNMAVRQVCFPYFAYIFSFILFCWKSIHMEVYINNI